MNEQTAFDRRRDTGNARLPAPRNPYQFCMHADPYCTACAREGTLLKSNHDIETRSWWGAAPRVAA